jgi:hypothetical protein
LLYGGHILRDDYTIQENDAADRLAYNKIFTVADAIAAFAFIVYLIFG